MRATLLLLLITTTIAAGCASSPPGGEAAYYAAVAAEVQRYRPPMVEIRAQPGATITGLESVTVYAPDAGHAAAIAPYRAQHHPAWSLAGDALRIGLPIYLGGQAAIGLADAVGRRVGDAATQPISGSYNTDASDHSVTGSHNSDAWSNDGRIDSPDDYSDRSWRNDGRIDSPDYDYTHDPIIVPQPEPIIVPGGGE